MDAEEFQSRLWGMFNVRFDSKLTLPQVERIRRQSREGPDIPQVDFVFP